MVTRNTWYKSHSIPEEELITENIDIYMYQQY